MKILFVCLGNICRSPMAEFLLKNKLKKRGVQNVEVASAATSHEEDGNPVYPPVARLLQSKGIDCSTKRARPLCAADGYIYDLLIGMEEGNVRRMQQIVGKTNAHKCKKLLDRDIADPWYTRDFETAYNDIMEGIEGLIKELL